MMKIFKEHKYFGLSIGIHLVILLCFIFNYADNKVITTNNPLISIPSYTAIITNPLAHRIQPRNLPSQLAVNTLYHISENKPSRSLKDRLPHPPDRTPFPSLENTSSRSLPIGSSSHPLNHPTDKPRDDVLLRLLHDAIAQQQEYPETAANLQQTGTVKIGFTLNPNGKLDKIKLIKSSSNKSIDLAALSAVNAISEIPEANQYLKQPSYFQVDVVFE